MLLGPIHSPYIGLAGLIILGRVSALCDEYLPRWRRELTRGLFLLFHGRYARLCSAAVDGLFFLGARPIYLPRYLLYYSYVHRKGPSISRPNSDLPPTSDEEYDRVPKSRDENESRESLFVFRL